MSETEDLPSFPSAIEQANNSLTEKNDWDEHEDDKGELKAALNVSFLESLEDSTKFSYAGVCAETLYLLYGVKEKYANNLLL